MKKNELSTVGGNVNGCSLYGEQHGGPLKSKNRAILWSRNPTLEHISGKD